MKIHTTMNIFILRSLAILVSLSLLPAPDWATCGGGGGGGTGGMRGPIGGGGRPGGPNDGTLPTEQVYQVPWKLIKPDDAPIARGLIVYWFPSSTAEFQNSSLRNSRMLSLYASQCVTMGVADAGTSLGPKFVQADKLPVVVLANPDGTIVSKIQNKDGFIKVDQVEKLVETEVKGREETIKNQMKAAKERAKSGDKDGAIPVYAAVVEQKCMFPGKAKDAAKELKKLGVESNLSQMFDGPIFDPAKSAQVENTMVLGLQAEENAKYTEAERLYSKARLMDPADPAPLRYLGELYRHHIGDWDKARDTFSAILNMPADPLSRAVALHGLGKMTIHDGEFKKGLSLMEDSVREYPIALAYRNLAVYWNSEGDNAKAEYYTKQALALDPNDSYNLVFAAALLSISGNGEDALKIARENEALLPASYNLAAIYAQHGQKDKALALLKRHFFEYESYQAVRAKEMEEARVDLVFAGIKDDPQFVALTSGADHKLVPGMPAGAAPEAAPMMH
jgi:tetratricopeptide (TPR) repeat protein